MPINRKNLTHVFAEHFARASMQKSQLKKMGEKATEEPVKESVPPAKGEVTENNHPLKEGVNNQTWEKYERLAELMGKDEVCDELMRAMSDKEANENLDWIIQMHDLGSEFKGMKGYEDDEEEEDSEEESE